MLCTLKKKAKVCSNGFHGHGSAAFYSPPILSDRQRFAAPVPAQWHLQNSPGFLGPSSMSSILDIIAHSILFGTKIADMHYANGETTKCKDVTPAEASFCSDLNTTSFVRRLIAEQNPDLVVFTGDNIDFDAVDAAKSMEEAFAPVLDSQTPWAAVLGNHDQESSMSRQEVMSYINGMKHSLSRSQPDGTHSIYGWGNYHLQINGPSMSNSENTSLLNLYFLDSGDYSKISGVGGYDWIRPNQQAWFSNLSSVLKKSSDHEVPGLAYFHIPLPEFKDVHAKACDVVGQQQEDVCSASVNSGFFTSLAEAADVKAVFVGHDHVNDFCGKFLGFYLCYAGGTGYHAYGKVGWSRRARVVLASLGHQDAVVEEIKTWKQLDGSKPSIKDIQVLWKKEGRICPYQPSLPTIVCVWSNIGWLIVTLVIGGSIAGSAYFYIKHVKKIYISVDTKSDQT